MTNNQAAMILAFQLQNGDINIEDLPAKAVGPVMSAFRKLQRKFTAKKRTGKKPQPRFSTMVRQWVAEEHAARVARNPRNQKNNGK